MAVDGYADLIVSGDADYSSQSLRDIPIVAPAIFMHGLAHWPTHALVIPGPEGPIGKGALQFVSDHLRLSSYANMATDQYSFLPIPDRRRYFDYGSARTMRISCL
jgi:hypothetical protein